MKISLTFLAIIMTSCITNSSKPNPIKSQSECAEGDFVSPDFENYLKENKYCKNYKECEKKALEDTRSSKRQYCCIAEFRSDIFVNEKWYKCRGFEEYRNEFGRLAAEWKCRGFSINWTSGDSSNSGWSVGTEFSRKLQGADCNSLDKCINSGKSSYPGPPECENEGQVEFVKKVDCECGYWVQNKVCKEGMWVRQDADFGCRSCGDVIQ